LLAKDGVDHATLPFAATESTNDLLAVADRDDDNRSLADAEAFRAFLTQARLFEASAQTLPLLLATSPTCTAATDDHWWC
jgi:hypothetical protein